MVLFIGIANSGWLQSEALERIGVFAMRMYTLIWARIICRKRIILSIVWSVEICNRGDGVM